MQQPNLGHWTFCFSSFRPWISCLLRVPFCWSVSDKTLNVGFAKRKVKRNSKSVITPSFDILKKFLYLFLACMNIQHSKLVSPKRQMWGYMLHSKTVTLFLDINYGSGLPSPPPIFPLSVTKHCMSLSIHLAKNRDPCPTLPTTALSDQWTDFRDFSPRFPNDSHAKARFLCPLPTWWWSQSWSCTRYCLQNFTFFGQKRQKLRKKEKHS